VWTALEDPVFGLAELPELDGIKWIYSAGKPLPQSVGIRAATENFRDIAHFPFVHAKTMGHFERQIDSLDVKRLGRDVHLQYLYNATGGVDSDKMWGNATPAHYHAIAPAIQCAVLEHRGKHMVLNAPSPVSATECIIYWTTGYSEGTDITIDEEVRIQYDVYLEDVPVLDSLQPPEAPLDLASQVHTPADLFTIEYRHAFVEYVHAVTSHLDGNLAGQRSPSLA
jgi:hypothetical protein